MQGKFQLYLRVSHFNGNLSTSELDFEPPFTDPLIDNVYFEFTAPAIEYESRLDPVNKILESTGEFGRVLVRVQTNVHCAKNWNGSACEILCINGNCSQGN